MIEKHLPVPVRRTGRSQTRIPMQRGRVLRDEAIQTKQERWRAIKILFNKRPEKANLSPDKMIEERPYEIQAK